MTLIKDPESPKEAENHINQIRQDRGLISGQRPNSNVADLERALKMCGFLYFSPPLISDLN
jgi:hypothetical protein